MGRVVYQKNLVEISEVTPRLYFRKADLRTRGQCNSTYLVVDGMVGVVDVPTLEAAEEMREEAAQLFERPIRFAFITHGHGDHVDGLPALLDQELIVFCSERLHDQLSNSAARTKATIVGVDDRTLLKMVDLDVECRAFPGTAHSTADMTVWFPEAKILCAGDLVVESQFLYFHSANVENWIAHLRKIGQEEYDLVIPGHGEIYPFSRVEETAAFIDTLARAAESCLASLSDSRIESISEQAINEIVRAFLGTSDPDALRIRELAGVEAHRELRMVLRYFLYKRLR